MNMVASEVGHDTKMELFISEGQNPIEETHTAAVCKELLPVGKTHTGEVNGRQSPMRRAQQGKGVRSSPPVEEASEEMCDHNTHSPLSCATWAEEIENWEKN